MKRLTEFLKTTALGGLFVLLPVLLLYLVLTEALEMVVALATPIADLFPKGTFDQVTSPVIIALILIVGVSFLIGLEIAIWGFVPGVHDPERLLTICWAFVFGGGLGGLLVSIVAGFARDVDKATA